MFVFNHTRLFSSWLCVYCTGGFATGIHFTQHCYIKIVNMKLTTLRCYNAAAIAIYTDAGGDRIRFVARSVEIPADTGIIMC
jgi:hypothetical protein